MTPSEVARAYLESFSSADPGQVSRWVTDGFVNEHTAALGSGCVGRDEYERRLPRFLESMPGLRYEVEDIIAEGPRVAAPYTLRAIVNGRPIAVRGVMILHVVDGRILRRTDYWDSEVFRKQAGIG